MQYRDFQIDPVGAHRPDDTLSFTVVTTTISGQRIEARVAVGPGDLHQQIVKATKNRSKRSRDGALSVTILSH